MQLVVTPLTFWKTEHTGDADNEDAWAVDPARGRFAVADGVGETSFAHQWAPVLVDRFVEDPLISTDPFEVEHWVRGAQAHAREAGLLTPPEQLSGIAQIKARQGAAATLLGLVLFSDPTADASSYRYHVTAVGDSNFFHWRPDASGSYELAAAFPLTSWRDFGSLPDSINSRTFDRDNTTVLSFCSAPEQDLQPGDLLLLATDAVAQWILRAYETADGIPSQHPLARLPMPPDPLVPPFLQKLERDSATAAWQRWILDQRAAGAIINDDSTLIIIKVLSLTAGADLARPDPLPAIQARSTELQNALSDWIDGKGRDLDIALAYGDGRQIEPPLRALLDQPPPGATSPVSHLQLWRANAAAFKAVTDAIRAALRDTDRKRQLADTWGRVGEQLAPLPWTGDLLRTLRSLDIQGLPLTTDASDGAASSAPLPQPLSDRSEQLRAAIKNWVATARRDPGGASRAQAAEIVRLYGADGQDLDPALRACIATPVLVDSTPVSHIALWGRRARATVPLE